MGAGEKKKEKRNEEMYIGRLLENSSPISKMTGIVRRVMEIVLVPREQGLSS